LLHCGLVRLILFGAVVIGAAQVRGSGQQPAPRSILSVGVWTLWHDKSVTVSPIPEGSATLRICGRLDDCRASPLVKPAEIRASADRLALAGRRDALSVSLSGPVALAAHGETLALRNPIRVTSRDGELILAVMLPVETYVERVVASESGPADSLESLKALAIVVRSFALHQAHGHADYDLCDSTHCQLLHWAGNPARQSAAHTATLATAGETLWFHGERADAWFHQNCGGRTASALEVWPERGQSRKRAPWPVSRIDNYCAAGGAKEWSANLSLPELTAALTAQGLAAPGWKSLAVARRGESGRAVTLLVGGNEISAEEFRLAVGRALGWNRIPSTWFEVAPRGDGFVFHGRGSGHGVGLCQAGAAAMAAGGRGTDEILAQYFPGAIVNDETTGHPWQTLRGQGFVLETLDTADASHLHELNQALAEAEGRSGLHPAGAFTVRAFRSTPAFRDATLAPGWTAAFTEGNWIGTQPLATLASRKLLEPVLRHEFLHALIEEQAASNSPPWLREGLAEALSGETSSAGPAPALKVVDLDRALTRAASQAEARAAHRAAGWYAARLLARAGRGQVLGWLHSGLPANAVALLQ
jgi:stage II sporulation protein D